MADNLKKGDKAELGTPQGKTTGTVKEKVTGEKRVANKGQKGTRVKGSKDDPRYVVESEKSGKRAAHKGDALKKKS
jgi:Hypervirulence associated proteins TUDOR domain